MAGTLFPEAHEGDDFIVVFVFAYLAVGVAKDARAGILGQESQDALLPPAALGNIVFFHESVVAVKGNGMEIDIERGTVSQSQAGEGVEPAAGPHWGARGRGSGPGFGEKKG